jgi:alpha-2-macroglobulin
VLYLNNYPFDCTEQIASRVLSNAALRDVLQAFASPQLPPPAELEASVREDLERLQRRQLPSGGFLYWSNVPDYPYASLHAAHALVRARDKGWAPPGRTLDRALSYAKAIERHIPAWYSTRARYTIRAYALYVRHRAGDSDRAEARRIFAIGLDELPLEAQGWILPVLAQTGEDDSVQAILRHWNNRVTETAAGAQFAETYGDTNDYVLMHGSRRTDAVLLEALLEVQPDHDLNVKVVRALLGHRKAGRWSTTQENSFVLLALDRYFRAYEGVTPNFVARIWIDGGFVGEAPFRGRTTERHHVDVPMAWLVDKDKRELVLGTEGEGRLYYRLGLRYAPADLQLPPAEHGFSIERRYEPIDDPADVSQSADGTWNIKAGARVRVRVTAVVPARRTMVALMDPLPAGLEPMNPSLAITGTVPADPNAQQTQRYWWWSRPWFSHQNLRDERAEAFGDLVWPGVHEYVYVATATTPGRYVVPPPRIEEMYHPETFGRGASARVVIR